MIRPCLLSCLLLLPIPALADDTRVFEFIYRVGAAPEAGAGPVDVFVPLAVDNEEQSVLSHDVQANIPGTIRTEPRHGNRYWHGRVESADGEPIELEVRQTVSRRVRREASPSGTGGALNDEQRAAFAAYLGPNERVVVGHEMLEPILAEIRAVAGAGATPAKARAIYDWVVDNVEYKKVGEGWGNGDTFWACTERYGNCTDFHALFISLARTEGIPARFQIGFPVPEDRAEGDIGGYHCWVEFWLPSTGWFPIDASEAFKHPARRDLFYGTQPADRIHFTTGRDLVLEGQAGPPLNYFVYPHIEVGGEPFAGAVEKSFHYRERPPAAAASGG